MIVKNSMSKTINAIKMQLNAMDCRLYDIGLWHSVTYEMINHEWTMLQVLDLKNLKWLRYMNLNYFNIYIRPAYNVPNGLIMLDDLTIAKVMELRKDGMMPVVEIETSKDNYQVWLRVGVDVPDNLRTKIACFLAKKYDADPASADARHYGRLAGFTNRKIIHMTSNGLFPWVKCIWSNRRGMAKQGSDLIRQAQLTVDELDLLENKRKIELKLIDKYQNNRIVDMGTKDIVEEYKKQMLITGAMNPGADISKCDWRAATYLAKQGWSQNEIMFAMVEASPRIKERKKGHVENYISLTVSKVMNRMDVREIRASLHGLIVNGMTQNTDKYGKINSLIEDGLDKMKNVNVIDNSSDSTYNSDYFVKQDEEFLTKSDDWWDDWEDYNE